MGTARLHSQQIVAWFNNRQPRPIGTYAATVPVEHLRAYADPAARTCTVPPLSNSCVDPRFHLVQPKGRASLDQMGNGNWATAPGYADSILSLYEEAKAFNNVR